VGKCPHLKCLYYWQIFAKLWPENYASNLHKGIFKNKKIGQNAKKDGIFPYFGEKIGTFRKTLNVFHHIWSSILV